VIILSFIFIFGCKQNEKLERKTVKMEREDWWLWTANWSPNDDQISVGNTQDTFRLFSSKTFKLRDNFPLEGTIIKCRCRVYRNPGC